MTQGTVKALVWVQSISADRWTADSVVGPVEVIRQDREQEGKGFAWGWRGQWLWFPTLEGAQAFAEADYTARILSALEPIEPTNTDLLAMLKHAVHWHDQISAADVARYQAVIDKAEGK